MLRSIARPAAFCGLCMLAVVVAVLIPTPTRAQAVKEGPQIVHVKSGDRYVRKQRPVRRDTPLREANIDDSEVQQIESLMTAMFPGSVVYISGVVTGCPCEDGPDCDAQVWSVANNASGSRELQLSKVDGEWQVGRLQQWWLIRDRIWHLYRRSRTRTDETPSLEYREYLRRISDHNDRYPACPAAETEIEAP